MGEPGLTHSQQMRVSDFWQSTTECSDVDKMINFYVLLKQVFVSQWSPLFPHFDINKSMR